MVVVNVDGHVDMTYRMIVVARTDDISPETQ